jgi:tRNA dimethylallyltransferase
MAANRILILGVTASGKARLAFELAQSVGAEILSVDSMKIYRRMDIGTAKPPKEAQEQVRYHLVDVAEPSESFSVGRFVELANKAIEDIESRGKRVVAVGGTALYIKSLLFGLFEGPGNDKDVRDSLKRRAATEGLSALHRKLAAIDPNAARRIHPNDEKRIVRALEVYQLTGRPISAFQQQWDTAGGSGTAAGWMLIGLRREKAVESSRMNARVKKMMEAGLLDEVRSLLAETEPLSEQARCAIGYAELIDHLEGKTTLEEAVELIKKNTRRFAKSQRTWFKTFAQVKWIDVADSDSADDILGKAKALLNSAPV